MNGLAFRFILVKSKATVPESEKEPDQIKHHEFNKRIDGIEPHGVSDSTADCVEPLLVEIHKFTIKAKWKRLLSEVCIYKQEQESCVQKLDQESQSSSF